jgi:hypothetical protein
MTKKSALLFQKKQQRKYRQRGKILVEVYEACVSNYRQSFRNKGYLDIA